ncbi:MAG: hypothetical protein PHQ75_00550 [Thermoguttaceae bacterium]|nr:hypothetical protein [Thermoguttaceae bacterium]
MSKSKINSRNKGAAGERELAHELVRVFGCTARRGQQFSGSPESPDVVTSLPGIHIECKRTERLNLYAAMDQATRDSGANEIPVVCHRSNRKAWVVIVRLDDLPGLLNNLLEQDTENDI